MKRKVPQGAEVRVIHIRAFATPDGVRHAARRRAWEELGVADPPLSHGGMTMVTIYLPNGDRYSAVAHCHEKDNFSRKKGRDIALGRALKTMEKKAP